ncbi:MAG: DUF2336 domain-containing protein [Maricaulaceae bacterium]
MSQLSKEMEAQVRRELSERFAETHDAPAMFLNRLANDEAAVAQPVLEKNKGFSDNDLIAIAKERGQGHLKAISKREEVSEAVADAIVERADDDTLATLVSNDGAQLSRQAMETAVDRAQNNTLLHKPIVQRKSIEADLLNEMYMVVEQRLRDEILDRNSKLDPEELNQALTNSREALALRHGLLPEDYDAARSRVRVLKSEHRLKPEILPRLLRQKETTQFWLAFAELTGLDFATARRVCEPQRLDAFAIACRAAQFPRSLFSTLVLLMDNSGSRNVGQAEELSDMYQAVDVETAQRTMRFWKVRKSAETKAA